MVLWEITLGTAYFLGLKRTYRLGLKIQRRIISPKYPKIRQFVFRRTRAVFDVALKVQRKIQERDLEAGRNLGNWILRWLDKAKLSAEIRAMQPSNTNANVNPMRQLNAHVNPMRQLTDLSNQKISRIFQKFHGNQYARRHPFTLSRNIWPKSFPTIAMMMTPKPAGTNIQYRQFSISGPDVFGKYNGRFGFGLMREDVRQWILHK